MYYQKRYKYILCVVILSISTSPSFASSFMVDLMDTHRILMPLLGFGGLFMVCVFLVSSRRGGESKQVEAYEAELEKFRQSIRR